MAKKKTTTNDVDSTNVSHNIQETTILDTGLSKTEEIVNDSAQLEEITFAESFAPEQSQSETGSTQDGYDPLKTSQEAQEGALEDVAIGEPTQEREQALNELVEPSGESGLYAEDYPVMIATDADEEEDDIVASEPDVELVAIGIKGIDYIDCVRQILYAGSLGAKINHSSRPQLKRVPYQVDLLIPVDMLETFNSKADMQEYDENIQYNQASLSSLDAGRFVEQLLEAGENGAILTPKKATNNFVTFAAAISNVAPFKDSATVQSAAIKRYYTYKELHEFKLNSLKIIASWYKVRKQPKWLMVQQILKAQRERQAHEEHIKLGS